MFLLRLFCAIAINILHLLEGILFTALHSWCTIGSPTALISHSEQARPVAAPRWKILVWTPPPSAYLTLISYPADHKSSNVTLYNIELSGTLDILGIIN